MSREAINEIKEQLKEMFVKSERERQISISQMERISDRSLLVEIKSAQNEEKIKELKKEMLEIKGEKIKLEEENSKLKEKVIQLEMRIVEFSKCIDLPTDEKTREIIKNFKEESERLGKELRDRDESSQSKDLEIKELRERLQKTDHELAEKDLELVKSNSEIVGLSFILNEIMLERGKEGSNFSSIEKIIRELHAGIVTNGNVEHFLKKLDTVHLKGYLQNILGNICKLNELIKKWDKTTPLLDSQLNIAETRDSIAKLLQNFGAIKNRIHKIDGIRNKEAQENLNIVKDVFSLNL